MDFLELLNPLKYFSQAEYISFWQHLFATLLSGFWARLIAALCLIFSFWFGVYRRRLGLSVLFFILTVLISYLGGLLRVIFWWAG